MSALHVQRQNRDAHFCFEALYWRDLVGPRDSSEAKVIDLLELFSNPFLE
jgi:hypothetical protein